MRHVLAIVLKILMAAAVLLVIMSMFNNYDPGSTFALSLLVVGLSYLIGDLGVLPMTNNTVATLADLGLVTLTVWLLGPFFVGASIPLLIALLSAVIIAVGEWFFHKYMVQSVLPRKDPQ